MEIIESRRGNILSFVAGALLGIVVTVLAVASFSGNDEKTWSADTTVDYGQQLALYGITEEGEWLPTGLAAQSAGSGESWIHPYIVVSPDKTKAAYLRWEDAKMHVYVSNLDGSDTQLVASQLVAEGHGELVKESFGWGEDSKALFYQERAGVCGEDGQALDGVPYPYDCSRKQYVMYKVNAETGEKEVVDRKIW